MNHKSYISIMLVVLVGLVTTGCGNDANTGALLGAGAGALGGQVLGGDTKSTLIGTAIGAGAGYLLGNQSQQKKETQAELGQIRAEMNVVTINVTNSNGSIIQVRLTRDGVGYRGPRNEYYPTLPTQDQLRPVYGF